MEKPRQLQNILFTYNDFNIANGTPIKVRWFLKVWDVNEKAKPFQKVFKSCKDRTGARLVPQNIPLFQGNGFLLQLMCHLGSVLSVSLEPVGKIGANIEI